jgi:glycosyltransferase involved in cell wall biosynthesis
MKSRLSIIIPFLNEEGNILRLVNELEVFFRQHSEFQYEIVFVDDGSTDQSVTLLKKVHFTFCTSKIIRLSKNFGSHAALRAGIFHATGEYIGFMYADLQDPLELIIQLAQLCKNGNDIAWAVRNKTDNSFFERCFSRFYSYLMQKYAVPSYPSNGFDIVMFSRKVQEHINKSVESNSSIFLQILTLGFRQTTIKYNKQVRKSGKSKWTLSKKVKLFIDSFVAFSYLPIRMVTVAGIVFFLTGLLWSSYVIFRKLVFNNLASGWPTLVSVLLIGFGITNISMGIIAEYLWRTLDASRNRPVFIIDEIIELEEIKID